MNNKRKRNKKDRYDGYYVSDIPAMNKIMSYLMPRRTDNECLVDYTIDMTEVLKFVEEKNSQNPEHKYTVFHIIMAAIAKLIYFRPRLNYFLSGYRIYERKDLSFTFVAKNKMHDDAEESILIFKYDRESEISPVDQVHDFVCKKVYSIRKHAKTDETTDVLNIIAKMPRFILKPFFKIIFKMSEYGHMPKAFRPIDPYSSTVFLSNLGSIKMSADYHHLVNWSTNSLFVIIGELKKQPFFSDDGSYEMRSALNIGVTVDERIADGFYFAKSIKLLDKILQNPNLLDLPINSPIDFLGEDK